MNIKGLWPEPTTKTTIAYICSEVYKNVGHLCGLTDCVLSMLLT